MARRWMRQELYEDQLAFWRHATVFEVDLTDPITPVVLSAIDEDDDPALVRFAGKEFRAWPKYRYSLDLRSPILRELRGSYRKRLEQEYAETFAALRTEVQDRLRRAGDLARNTAERLDRGKVAEDDLRRLDELRVRWTETREWPFVARKRKVRVAADAEPAPHQALGAALAYLHPAVRIRLALADEEVKRPDFRATMAARVPEPSVRLGGWHPISPRLRTDGARAAHVPALVSDDTPLALARRRGVTRWASQEQRVEEYLRQARLWLEYWSSDT